MSAPPYTRPRPLIEEMEARVLYSADLMPAVIDAGASAVVEQRTLASDGEFVGITAPSATAAPHEAQTHELVFVDVSIPHAEELIADIRDSQSAQRQVEIVRIASDADGITAISEALSQHHDIDAVHILGHGRNGEVQLGVARLDFDSLLQNATRIKRWGDALNENADVLLYGCDVAQSDAGRALVDALSRLTGADVGASDNPTGNQRLGDDWNLEYQVGTVQTGVVVSAAEQRMWDGLLDEPPPPDSTSPPPTVAPAPGAASVSGAQLAAVPLAFEQNLGQADAQVDFLTRGSGYGVWLTGGDAVLSVGQGDAANVVGLKVVGRNTALVAQGEGESDAKTNYFIGDPDQWHTDVANFNGVRYDNVYDGIDLRYYGNQTQLEYDFIVRAGADANAIELRFEGAQNQTIADNGDLILTLDAAGNTISFKAPVAYQEGANGREAVDSRYVLGADGTVNFALGAYDHSKQLVIDPVLSYATYFGGNAVDNPNAVAVDAAGYVYVTGYTSSTNMPLAGALFGGQDVFVAKFTPDLSGLVYAAYVGGNQTDQSAGIAVDASGNAYVTGHTLSSNFPTVSAYQSTRSGTEDAYVFKLNAAGNSLLYSTYFGGTGSGDDGVAITVDATGAAYVAGDTNSSTFPVTAGAFDTSYAGGDAFIAKFTASGTLAYSTFLGGSLSDGATGIALDGSGNAVVVGQTSSSNFPTTVGAYHATSGGGTDVFVVKLNSSGSALLYSTYLGGGGTDIAFAVALGPNGKIYLTGETNSVDFDVTAGAYQIANAGGYDAFMAVVDPAASAAASLVYSTYLGGSGSNEAGLGVAVDSGGRGYVGGYSDSNGGSNGLDVYVAQVDPGSAGAADLLYYSFLGSTGQDRANAATYHDGKFIIVGDTAAISGIATPGAYDTTYNSGTKDGFLAIYTFDSPPSIAVNTTPLAYMENAGPVVVDATLTVADGDSATLAGATVQITANYMLGEDLLGFDNANPWGITGVWNAAAATMTLSGSASVASYQGALRSVTYQNSSERPSMLARMVSFTASDGTQSSASVNRQIGVASVDDAPVNTVPGPQTVAEDTPLIFSIANANRISVDDVDAVGSAIQVTLNVMNGKLTLAQTAGLTFVTGDGIGNQTMTFTGALTSINAALDGLRFDPAPDFTGTTAVQLITNDQGNTGSGGPLSATSSIIITVNGVNDAPINSLPGPQSTPQNTTLVFSSGNGNAITVSDVDAGSGTLQITLTATNGTVTLGSLTGLTGIAGNGTASVTFSGSITNLNGALNGLSFAPTSGYGGPASLLIVANDLGNNGTGGAATDTDTLAITVSGNVAPTVATSGGALAYTEQAAAAAVDAGLTVNDVDTPLLNHAVVRIAANYVGGQDLLAFVNQLGITGGWDGSSGTLTLSGAASAAAYQTALRSVTYHNSSDKPSTALRTVTFVVNDGNADSAIAARQIAVTAVNDPPLIVAPGAQSSPEDASLVFSAASANQISVADADAGASPVTLSLSALNGTLTLAQTNGLVIAGGADGSSAMTLIGTVDDLNAALNGLAFVPVANATGTARVDISIDDNGNTGTGGSGVTSASVPITLASVNDAPSGTPKTITTAEDTPYVFSVIDFGFSDAQDVPANQLAAVRIAALPLSGSLTDNGIAIVIGQDVSIADINAGKLVFSPGLDAHGAGYASFTFQVRDDGGTAIGGIDLDQSPRSMTIDVTPVNDAPVGIDVGVTVLENSVYTFALADISFNDPNDAPANNLLGVRLASLPTAGSLTLAGAPVPIGAFISAIDIAAGNLKFTPAPGVSGPAYSTFSFRLQDDGGTANGGVDLEATAHTMTVDVIEINQAPQGTDNTVNLLEDTPYALAAADFGFSDSGNSVPNQLLGVKFASIAGAGTLRDNGVAVNAGDIVSATDIAFGRVIFTPVANANGAGYASFTFQVQDDGGSANGGVDLALAANTMTIDVSAVDDAPVIAQNTLTLAQGASVQLSAAQLSATDVDDPAAGLLFTVSAVTHGQFELSSAPALAIVSFTQAQIAAGQVLFVHDATTSAPTYDVSVSDGTLTAGPAPASISFSAGAPAIAPTSAPMPPPSIPSPAPVPAAPAQDPAEPAPLPTATDSTSDNAGAGGSDSAGGGGGAGGEGGEGGVGGGGGAVGAGVASAPRIGVIAAADIVKPLRADVRELSPQKSSSWFYEAPSISAVDLNLAGAIGSEPLMRFQGNAQADWSIASAYTDNSASEHKEQLSVLLDSAQFAGVAMSVGVVWWASRLTGVVGSLLASVPAWRHLDPLPVVGQDEALDEADWNEDPNDLDADADELAISMVLDGAPSAVAMSG